MPRARASRWRAANVAAISAPAVARSSSGSRRSSPPNSRSPARSSALPPRSAMIAPHELLLGCERDELLEAARLRDRYPPPERGELVVLPARVVVGLRLRRPRF